jgi:hypothetical protein
MFASTACNDHLPRISIKRTRQNQSFKRLLIDKSLNRRIDLRDDNERDVGSNRSEFNNEQNQNIPTNETLLSAHNQKGGFKGWVLNIRKNLANFTKKFTKEES